MNEYRNIVFIISDQHRGNFLGFRGTEPQLQTPNLDRLAADGVSFDRAYTQCPLCVPSRASLLTGKYPSTIGSAWAEKVIQNHLTLAQHLTDHGYHTGHIGKGHLMGETEEQLFGFQERRMRFLYQTYEDYAEAASQEIAEAYLGVKDGWDKRSYNYLYEKSPIPSELHFDTLVVDEAEMFIKRNRGRKFYLQLGIEKPHPEWYPPDEYLPTVSPDAVSLPDNWQTRVDNVPERRKEQQEVYLEMGLRDQANGYKRLTTGGFSEQEAKNAKAAYLASINYVDWLIGRVRKALEENGIADNTLIVYSADHGDLCFDHGMLQKHCGYEGAINVPLIFAGPGVQSIGRYQDGLAELLDLYPTFCDYLGVPQPEGLQGESLVPTLTSKTPPQKKVAISEFFHQGHVHGLEFPERAVRSQNWKYINNGELMEELYDEINDPMENRNLSTRPEYRDQVKSLHKQLQQRIPTT